MSLIDAATELEFVPEQELIELSQNPQSRYPQFLVLSEVQRRNQMRRMYENQVNKAEQPLTTVAEEKVMELAQSSAMPNVPSPMSNETSQSPRGLLGMASEPSPIMMESGRSTSKDTLEEVSNELRRIARTKKSFDDFSDAVVNAVKLGTMDRETAERLLVGNSELFLDASRSKEFTPYYGIMPTPFRLKEDLRDIIKKSRNEMQQEQLGLASGRSTNFEEPVGTVLPFPTKEFEGTTKIGDVGLGEVLTGISAAIPVNVAPKILALQKAINTLKPSFDKAIKASRKGNVEYAQLDPLVKAQASKYVQLNKEAEKLETLAGAGTISAVGFGFNTGVDKFVKEFEKNKNKSSGGLVSLQQGRTTDYQENIERSLQAAQGGQRGVPSDDPRLFMPYVPVESGDKSRARRTVLPPTLSGDLQAQNEQALLRESFASTGNLEETGTSQANISEGETPKTNAEGTNVLQQIFDTSGQLGLPKVEIPRMTEEEKQRELGIYALGIMADAFGTGKNIGEAGSKLGKGVQGLLDIKRTQRQDDIKADSAIRAQSVEDITLANTLLKTQLLADQYEKQGETNKVKALEIIREEIERLGNTIPDEKTQKRILKLQLQLDAELEKMFGTEALATYPGI